VLNIIAAVMLLAAGTPSRPAKATASAQKVAKQQRARQLNERGVQAIADHRYDDAITTFEEARRLAAWPSLTYNLAEAHRLAGHTDAALALYHEYVERVGDPAKRADTTALERLERDSLAPPPAPISSPVQTVAAVSEEAPPRPPSRFKLGAEILGVYDPGAARFGSQVLVETEIGGHWSAGVGASFAARPGAVLSLGRDLYRDDDVALALTLRGMGARFPFQASYAFGGGGTLDLRVPVSSWLELTAGGGAEVVRLSQKNTIAPVLTFGLRGLR